MRAAVLAGAAAFGLAGALPAQTGLLVVAHGAGPEWNQRVREVVEGVSWGHGPVELAFLMGPEAEAAGWDVAVSALGKQGAASVVVVPLMVSSYGGHYRQIQYFAGELDSLPPELLEHDHHAGMARPVPMRVTPALDGAPEMVEGVVERWRELGAADRGRPVLLVAHGPNDAEDSAHWLADLDAVAAGLSRAGAVGDVRPGLLRDDAPPPVRAEAVSLMRDTIQALASRAHDSVVVMPVLISTGTIDRTKIPRDVEGLPVRYSAQPLAPLPQLARWIERVAQDALLAPKER